jgi:hypothetical protein
LKSFTFANSFELLAEKFLEKLSKELNSKENFKIASSKINNLLDFKDSNYKDILISSGKSHTNKLWQRYSIKI